MGRLKRNILPGYPYHVTRRGLYGQTVFHAEADRADWLGWLGEALANHGAELHAYVLMGNHIHLLLTPAREDSLSAIMKHVGERLARRVNARLDRRGALWDARFLAGLVAGEAHFMAAMRYIEQNPVRAGLAARAADWRWSSHGANAGGNADALVTPHPLYDSLGPDPLTRRTAYGALFDDSIPDELVADLRRATLGGFATGDAAEIRRLERRHGCRLTPRAPGPKDRQPDNSVPGTDLFE